VCTLTIFPASDGFQLAMNRDELRSRPAALPPEIRSGGGRSWIMPVDPVGGGTWIAASDAGVAMALLNLHDVPWSGEAEPAARMSRGTIIPHLIEAGDVEEAVRLARGIRPADYQPFRLVATDSDRFAVFASDGNALRISIERRGSKPLLFTSSGLGDRVVDVPRRRLFTALLEMEGPTPAVQQAFHRHSWPDRRDVSVCMERPEARTVSCTTVEVSEAKVDLRYFSNSPDQDPPLKELTLRRKGSKTGDSGLDILTS
jgi:hypothetical protein